MADEKLPDPRQQHEQPDTEGEQLPPPGSSGSVTPAMGDEPDHGEDSYRGSGRLADRVAIVTGGDSGIGRAVSLAFAREGADVVLAYLPDEEDDGEATAKLVESSGRRALKVPGDLTSEDSCRELVDRTVSEFGRVDILVNNAAYQMAQPGGIADITTEQFDRVMKTNLYAMFWLCKMALPHMTSGSSIINTTSVQSSSPSPELLDYATTKAGIVNFTRGLATMVAADGIRVNAVAPGPIWTPLIPATMPEEKIESFGQQTPLGRVGQPAELAPAYVFLASAEASYITAEVIAVTGGMPVPV
ncbi:MAG: Dehydrogenases with different specificities (related to short-chain alcohol dehydrogenases) [uncultured Nocardioidaceae bacterium]|uniref:Dehydrogenases with different specificities (Related to short-chain alcohol dehydrogenases) n=1 Tax=uncultured Nocardioidaceae bacterium TaxID=253824 RepID=A0A6J4MVP1_9ACTN|nr:MAG: Dehydrogenases with different specificities (related to short-chain alcohol dehydrogenases) [uncultured Nocardioidaceae bacterium]